MFQLPVHAVREFAPGLFAVTLERRGFRFVPGECAVLWDDGDESRPYSIASGPEEPHLRFLVRRMAGGAVSPWLAARRPGDAVRISTPFGDFRPGQCGAPGAPAVFLATGVGIAPYLSWLRSGGDALSAGGRRPLCVYGVRHLADACDLDLLRSRTDLRLAVSREVAAGCHHGRLTDLLPRLPLEPGTEYYACGLDAMVDTVARWLDQRGVPAGAVHTEVFFS